MQPTASAGAEHCTVCLCEPLPPYAQTWVSLIEKQARRLPLTQRLSLLGTAAASGSEVNLEVALKVLQPGIFPDALQDRDSGCNTGACSQPYLDPGVEAVSCGHPQLLAWLLRRCPGLVCPMHVLREAPWHCDLGGLQSVRGSLQAAWDHSTKPANGTSGSCSSGGANSNSSGDGGDGNTDGHGAIPYQDVLDVAAKSCTPDAVAKMDWVLQEGAGSCCLQESTAEAAAHTGDLGRLRWLRDRGCPMGGLGTLEVLLRRADLQVVQWAVDEGVCALPPEWDGGPAEWDGESGDWPTLQVAAAQSSDGVAKLRWLQERGAPPLQGPDGDEDGRLLDLTRAATEAGQVEVVRYLHGEVGGVGVVQRDPEMFGCAAAESKSIPMAECMRQAGAAFTPAAFNERWMRIGYETALQMIRWLTTEAGVAAPWMDGLAWVVREWPNYTPADGQQTLEAVQLLVDGTNHADAAWSVVPGVITGAASCGNVALVQYLAARLQRPVSKVCEGICHDAVHGGCEALLEWMVQQHPGCFACSVDYTGPYVTAAIHGDRGTLEVLRRLDVPWSPEDSLAAAVEDRCGLPALRWLVEQRMPVYCEPEVDRSLTDYDADVRGWLGGLVTAAAAAFKRLAATVATASTEHTASASATVASEAAAAATDAAATATAIAATVAATAAEAAEAAATATAAANTATNAAGTAVTATTMAARAAAAMTAYTSAFAAMGAAASVAKAVAAGNGAGSGADADAGAGAGAGAANN